MLQLTINGLKSSDPLLLADLKSEFAERHAVILPGFLGPDILEFLYRRLNDAPFRTRSDFTDSGEEFAREHALYGTDLTVHILFMLLNNKHLFEALQSLTGCSPIGNYLGRIYRMNGDSNHYDSWHNDVDYGRLLGISINLGREPYEGGEFQLREENSGRLLCNISHTCPGNAHLFRISPQLKHRVMPVRGPGVRLVAAGWFQSGPNAIEVLKLIRTGAFNNYSWEL